MRSGLWILVVNPDPQMCRFLQSKLTANQYCVFACDSSASALAKMVQLHPDFIILDTDLPDHPGLALLEQLRTWTKTPVLVITRQATTEERISALDAGADDCIAKPFCYDELLARMRAILRRVQLSPEALPFTHGDLQVDLARRLVTVKGHRVMLTPHEYALLRLLVQHAGVVLPHRQILSTVWGPTCTDETHYGHVCIAQLRQKLEPDPKKPTLILTEPRIGYRLATPAAFTPIPS